MKNQMKENDRKTRIVLDGVEYEMKENKDPNFSCVECDLAMTCNEINNDSPDENMMMLCIRIIGEDFHFKRREAKW